MNDPSATSSERALAFRRDHFGGMACLNTSSNPRIPILMELVGALSRAVTPSDVLRDFGRGMAELQGQQGYISLSTRGLGVGEYRVTRILIDEKFDGTDITDTWSKPKAMPVHKGGFLGSVIRQAYPEIIHHLAIPDDPVIGKVLEGYGSLMAIPLFDDGEPLNWAIMLRRDPEGFSVEDLEESILRSNLVGTTVRNVLAAQQLRDANEKIREEMQRIGRIQRALLPQSLPAIPGAALGASYATFDHAGGDYYDIWQLDGDRWAILIADATGHGPAAAVVMAMMHAIVNAYPKNPAGPAEVLEHANTHLHAKRIEHSFVTAALGFYTPSTRTFTYARAGHNPVLRMEASGGSLKADHLDAVGGLPLGVMDDVEYEEATIELCPGQTLVFYTDGITEAMSPERAMFGVEGMERSLTVCSGEPDCVISHVNNALVAHQSGERPTDDQTLLVMRIDDE